MNLSDFEISRACDDDAELVAECIVATSEGIVEQLLGRLAQAYGPGRILAAAMLDSDTQYSLENVWLLRHDGEVIGLLFMYPASEHRVRPIMEDLLAAERLAVVREILSTAVPGSMYINTLWVHESWRGSGVADVLIRFAAAEAEDRGLSGLSLHVWEDNTRALTFYENCGFSTREIIAVGGKLAVRHPLGSRILFMA